ncbi:UNVERIFIED_ORG: quercetin 2,3-dioxygenase [Heyndrickxia coagulans]
MKTNTTTSFPKDGSAYFLKSGEGEKYLLGSHVAEVIADAQSTSQLFEIVMMTGGKGAHFPAHRHNQATEAILLLDGRLELFLDGKSYLLTPGDYAHIPAGVIHEYEMRSHYTRFLSFASKGNMTPLYRAAGVPYDKAVHPPHGKNLTFEQIKKAAVDADLELVGQIGADDIPQLVQSGILPDEARPYVLEAGQGIQLLFGDQLQKLLATQKTTNGDFIAVMTEGPVGDRIINHYHEHHTETFFCIQGIVTMWINGKEIRLEPGDFVHCPPHTIHSYRCDSNYTKFAGFLSPGLFEPFFRTLGDEYEDYIFPFEPRPLRFDRVLQKIDELDLKIVDLNGGPQEKGNHLHE